MEYGAHLPLIEFDGGRRTLADLVEYARRAAALGYRYLCANDHLLFGRPWIDGPTALAATIEASGEMTLATTVCLPVIRGPVQSAKTLAAIDILSDGRLVAGVGPGSSPRDYAAAGVPFEQRWARFDEAIRALRSLLRERDESFDGEFYSTDGVSLEPPPANPAGPPIWIASWGSPAGLRRVARLGDGWLASGYNTTPARFRESLARLRGELGAAAVSPEAFPNAIATTWLYVTDSPPDAKRMLRDVLAPMLGRPVEALRELALPIGSAEECAERIAAYQDAGAERIFVWPLADDLNQLERFRSEVAPLVPAGRYLEIERVLPAAPSVVFRAFTVPEELARWWGPQGFTVPSLEFIPRVGERYRIEMQPPEGDPFCLIGEFREVAPPARLAYTFIWEDPDPDDVETLVELSFRDLGESTKVALSQRAFKTEARRELHRNGWTDSFDKLEELIAGG